MKGTDQRRIQDDVDSRPDAFVFAAIRATLDAAEAELKAGRTRRAWGFLRNAGISLKVLQRRYYEQPAALRPRGT